MGWGGRWEGDSGWGTHVHPWLIHVNVWQKPLPYCKVFSLQLKLHTHTQKTSLGPGGISIYWIILLSHRRGQLHEDLRDNYQGAITKTSPVHLSTWSVLTWALIFSSVQPLSHVLLFVTPWTTARQVSLSITNSQSLLKLIFLSQ